MAQWNMQIRAARSWKTSSSTPSDYAELTRTLEDHVIKCLASLTINDTPTLISPKMPTDHHSLLSVALCQQNLTWDHLPDDLWTDDIERWLFETEQATEAEPAPTTSASETSTLSFQARSCEPLSIDVHFTDIQWQRTDGEYSPSVYSKKSSAISTKQPHKPAPLIIEMPLSPTQYISIEDILDLASNMADVCIELRNTTNRAEDSAEFDDSTDNGSNSDVSMLDLNASGHPSDVSMRDLPLPPRTFYELARDRGLTIASDRFSSHSGSHQSSIDRRHHRSNAPSPGSSRAMSYDRHRGLYRNNGPTHSRFNNRTSSAESESTHKMDIDRYEMDEMDIDAHRHRYNRNTSARSSSTASSSSSSSSSHLYPPPTRIRREYTHSSGSSSSSGSHLYPSPIRIQNRSISPGILSRMAKLKDSGLPIRIPRSSMHDCALPTDGKEGNGGE
jgi:hypothetical protein